MHTLLDLAALDLAASPNQEIAALLRTNAAQLLDFPSSPRMKAVEEKIPHHASSQPLLFGSDELPDE